LIASVVAVAVLAMAVVEGAYHVSLARLQHCPRAPTTWRGPPKAFELIWADVEGTSNPNLDGLYPWHLVARVLGGDESALQGSRLAALVSRECVGGYEGEIGQLDWVVSTAAVSIWLTRNTTPEQLAASYLETAYFGHGSNGLESASRTFFGKSQAELTLGEVALLISVTRRPISLNPWCDLESVSRERNALLVRANRLGFIDEQQMVSAMAPPVLLEKRCPR
jgi:hypothetical protein